MQDPASELRRIPLPRTLVNRPSVAALPRAWLAANHGEIFGTDSPVLVAACSAQRASLIRLRNEGRVADEVMHRT